MDNNEKAKAYLVSAIALGIIWLLAVFWHPFGNPLPIWHWTNAILLGIAVRLFVVYAKKSDIDEAIETCEECE